MATPAVSDKGELALLRNAVRSTGTPPRNWKLRLYTNNHTPTSSDASPSVYTEASFPGYAAQSITGWGIPATYSGKAKSIAASNAFTAGSLGGGTQTIYGYYVTDDDDSDALLWAVLFDSPQTINLDGQILAVQPFLTLASE